MTSQEFGALLRTILQFIAGYAVAKGIGDAELWVAITAGVVAIGSGVWSYLFIKKAGKAISQAPSQ